MAEIDPRLVSVDVDAVGALIRMPPVTLPSISTTGLEVLNSAFDSASPVALVSV